MSEKPDASDNLIDIPFILIAWLKWSWFILLLAPVGAYFGYRDLQAFQPMFSASMIVQPSSENTPQFTGRAATLLNLGQATNATTTDFDRLNVLMNSRSLAAQLQREFGLMQIVFARSWDAATGTWIKPSGEDFERSQRMNRFFRRNGWSEPTLETLARFIDGSIKFERIEGTGFFRISHEHKDADFAVQLLEMAYGEADELLRAEDRIESAQRKAYVIGQLETATVVEMRQSLIGLLAAEERRGMLLDSNLPYAARIIEPPAVSNLRTEPDIRQMFGFPILIALMIGLALVTVFVIARKESP